MAKTAKTIERGVRYEIEIEPGEWHEIEGSFASGDEEADREQVEEIRRKVRNGDEWAWCSVRVVAITADGARGYSGWLGGCSYANEADFRTPGGYFDDMCREAVEDLVHVGVSGSQVIRAKDMRGRGRIGSRRVKVSAYAGTRYYPYDYEIGGNMAKQYAAAVRQFCIDLGWTGQYIGGQLGRSDEYVFVQTSNTTEAE